MRNMNNFKFPLYTPTLNMLNVIVKVSMLQVVPRSAKYSRHQKILRLSAKFTKFFIAHSCF